MGSRIDDGGQIMEPCRIVAKDTEVAICFASAAVPTSVEAVRKGQGVEEEGRYISATALKLYQNKKISRKGTHEKVT